MKPTDELTALAEIKELIGDISPEQVRNGIKAIRSVRCVNQIITDLGKFEQTRELESEFSTCLQRHLTALKGRVMVFWSPRHKGSLEELKRPFDVNLHLNETTKMIGDILLELNAGYDSIPFLERLMQKGVGISHVFSIRPAALGFTFSAFPELLGRKANVAAPPASVLDAKAAQAILNDSDLGPDPFDQMLATLRLLTIDTDEKRRQKIRTSAKAFCDQWARQAYRLLDVVPTLEQQNRPIQTEFVSSACSHFALMILFARNYRFEDISLILASAIEGHSPSSMGVFWPDRDELRYEDIGLPFQLQMILRLGALRMTQPQQLAMASYGIAHPLKNHLSPLRRSVERVQERCENLEDPSINKLLVGLLERVKQVEGFAELAHLMHHASTAPDRVFEVERDGKPRFAVAHSLNLSTMVQQIAKEREIELDYNEQEKWTVEPRHSATNSVGKLRLDDLYYNMIIYELLANAARHGVSMSKVAIRVAKERSGEVALVFSNPVLKSKLKPGLEDVAKWTVWDEGAPTGIKCIAAMLQMTKAGNILFCIRPAPEDSRLCYFEVKLFLEGLTVEAA